MPLTGLQHQSGFNDIHRRIAGHTPIDRAAAYFHYDRDSGYAGLSTGPNTDHSPVWPGSSERAAPSNSPAPDFSTA